MTKHPKAEENEQYFSGPMIPKAGWEVNADGGCGDFLCSLVLHKISAKLCFLHSAILIISFLIISIICTASSIFLFFFFFCLPSPICFLNVFLLLFASSSSIFSGCFLGYPKFLSRCSGFFFACPSSSSQE